MIQGEEPAKSNLMEADILTFKIWYAAIVLKCIHFYNMPKTNRLTLFFRIFCGLNLRRNSIILYWDLLVVSLYRIMISSSTSYWDIA